MEKGNKIRNSKPPLYSESQGERMVNGSEVSKQAISDIELMAARSARERARVARWDLDVAIFLFAILIIIMLLLFQGIGLEIVAPVAIFGLTMVWLVGWRRGRQLYQQFYQRELLNLKKRSKDNVEDVEEKIEERIDELVQEALRERRR